MPEKDEPGLLRVIATYFSSMFNKNYDTVDSVTCFHHVMLQQWIAKGKHKSARYVELNLPRDEGIGSILGTYTDLVNFVKRAGQQILARPGTSRYVQGQMDTTLDYGWLQVTVRPGTSRYSDKLLEKYFNVKMTPMDAFPDKVITIAQERYSVKDFEVAQTISELETMRRSPEEYELYVEDTTVNYFYGIYLVSRCDTFIHSNNCCGAQLVKSFGEGIIKRTYCIAEELMKEHK